MLFAVVVVVSIGMFLVSIRRCAFSYRASSRTLSSSTRKLQSTYQKANEQPKAPVLSETNVPSHPSLLSAIKAPVFQPYDILLVVDFEGTCTETSGFDYPNEIIVRRILHVSFWSNKASRSFR